MIPLSFSPDTKTCTCCDRMKAVTEFRMKKKRLKSGQIGEWRDSRCHACRWVADRDRYQRRQVGMTLPPGRPVTRVWGRPNDECECDRALEAWPVIERGALVPCLGVAA